MIAQPHHDSIRLTLQTRSVLALALCWLSFATSADAATLLFYQFTGTDGSNATSVTDSSGNGLTGTGSTFGTGAVLPKYASSSPGSVILDGVGGPVINASNSTSVKFENAGVDDASPIFNTNRGGRITVSSTLLEPASFTIEMFVRVDSNIQFASLAGKERNGGSTWLLDTNNVGNAAANVESADSQLRLRVDHQELALGGGNPGFNQNIGSSSPAGLFGDGEWHHIAVTYNDATNTFSFFKDYVAAGSGTINSQGVQDLVHNGGLFFLGNLGGGRAFDGWMDEVRFSDNTLTTDQFLRAVPEPRRALLLILSITALAIRRRR